MRVLIVSNNSERSRPAAYRARELFAAAGDEASVSEGGIGEAAADLCVVVGGDGTVLHVGKEAALRGIPVLALNTGRVGFLTAQDAEKAKVEENLKDMKELLEQTKDRELTDDEIDKIKAGKEKLMTGAQALFAKMYEAQGAGAQGAPDPSQFAQGMGGDMGGGADASAGNGPAADDVVDGDYREV